MLIEDEEHIRTTGLLSVLSVVSKPLKNTANITEESMKDWGNTNYEKRVAMHDFNKNAIDYLLEEKTDYLIIDCADCRKTILGHEDLNEITSI